MDRRDIRVSADKQQAQDIIAVIGAIEPFRQFSLGIFEIGNLLFGRQGGLLRLPANMVETGITANKDQPGGRITRRPLHRPGFQGAQTRFLKGFLRAVEIAEIAQQSGDGLRPGCGNTGAYPRKVAHFSRLPG